MKKLLTIIGATILSLSVKAETVTIDFEEWSEYTLASSFTSNGYQFVNDNSSLVIHSHNIIIPDYGYDLAIDNYGSGLNGVIITSESSASFSLQEFDAASYELNGTNIYTDYFAIGTRALDGSQISFVFDANEGMVTYSPEGFTNLTSLAFYAPERIDNIAAGFHLDNIILSTVPIPASVWLLGSGLVCLLGISKRKRQCRHHSVINT